MVRQRVFGVRRTHGDQRLSLLLPLLLLAVSALAVACAPLMRGMSGTAVVSSSRPAVLVRPAAGLELLGSGVASPLLSTELGLRPVDVGWALYADAARGRHLAVLLSEAPDGWRWELDVSGPWREVPRAGYTSGPARFSGAAFLMPVRADPFTTMLPAPSTSMADEGYRRWLVQRYAQLSDFRAVKLVVEYREPLPGGVGAQLADARQLADALDAGEQPSGGAQTLLGAFEARARAAFSVAAYPAGGVTAERFALDSSTVRVRDLANVIGRMEPVSKLPERN